MAKRRPITNFHAMDLISEPGFSSCYLTSSVSDTPRVTYTIPINSTTNTQAERSLRELISPYRQNISFDNNSGEITIGGLSSSTSIPYQRDYWFSTPNNNAIETRIDILPTRTRRNITSFRYKEKSRFDKFLDFFKWRKLR